VAGDGGTYPVWVFRDLGARGSGWTAWQSRDDGSPLLGGERFPTVEEALAWARDRSGQVLVNVDRDRRRPTGWWSAGDEEPQDGETYPPWPPARYRIRLAIEALPDEVLDGLPEAVDRAAGIGEPELRLRPSGPGSLQVAFFVEAGEYSDAERLGMEAFFPALDAAWEASGAGDAPLFFSFSVTPLAA
jgi:hypothetical protein